MRFNEPTPINTHHFATRGAHNGPCPLHLDQACLAKLGSYQRSEILFLAGVHSAKKARELSKGEIGRWRATLNISPRSYALRGVIIPERQYKALNKKGLSYGKARFFVFSRANQPCRVCKTKIQRSTANSRRIYTCATCQPDD
jgi:endonuclease-8